MYGLLVGSLVSDDYENLDFIFLLNISMDISMKTKKKHFVGLFD